jgi:hypothetical protein
MFSYGSFKNSILIKDNLVKRGWEGDETCRFCNSKETINHLFFECALARYIWGVVVCSFDLTDLPSYVESLCSWTMCFKNKRSKALVTIGVAAILWTVWNVRNGA